MSDFYMAGTEGTGRYSVLLKSALGRVGVRFLTGDMFRLRIEPASPAAAATLAPNFPDGTYKQPGNAGQDRFSMVGYDKATLSDHVAKAVAALVKGGDVKVNNDVVEQLRPFLPDLESPKLVAILRFHKVPGCNLAPRWSKASLERQVALYDTPDKKHARLLHAVKARKFRGANYRWRTATLEAKLAQPTS